ncbi:MAG: phage major tail tube protein [Pigmentiphaga sp.]|nr:phage major tail tube protein [Pigmentiphaga sp.]
MNDKIAINRVTNANVYMNGNSLLGRAEEVELPQVKHKMAEHKALGMVGTAEFFAGVDKMEAKIKWTSFYIEVLRSAVHPFKTVQLQTRSSLETYTGQGRTTEVPVMVMMTAAFKEFPLGSFKQHEPVVVDTALSVYYAAMEIDKQQIFEIDVLNNIYKVAGDDVLATYRLNIGA